MKKKLVIAIGLIITCIIIFIVIYIQFSKYKVIDVKDYSTNVKDYLTNKYSEKFEAKDIEFLGNINYMKGALGLDGSTFWKGTKTDRYYYKVTSVKNNIQFYAYYEKKSSIGDSYDSMLNQKKTILEILDEIDNSLDSIVTEYYIDTNNEDMDKQQMRNAIDAALSELETVQPKLYMEQYSKSPIEVKVNLNKNFNELCTHNYYNILNDLNSKLCKTRGRTYATRLRFIFKTKDSYELMLEGNDENHTSENIEKLYPNVRVIMPTELLKGHVKNNKNYEYKNNFYDYIKK